MKGIFEFKGFGWVSLWIVAGYFLAGFWPFAFRVPNRVEWLKSRPGLHFEPRGIAYDPQTLPGFETNITNGAPAPVTIEAWLEPDGEPADDAFDILSISTPRLPANLALCQWIQALILRIPVAQSFQHPFSEVGLNDALHKHKATFVAVCGSGQGTDFFQDGKLAGENPHQTVTLQALNGRLVLGNEDAGRHSWSGSLLGLAIYNRAVDERDLARQEKLWKQAQGRQLANDAGLVALYLFDEHGGSRAEDSSRYHHHIEIPEIFQPVRRDILLPPSLDFSHGGLDYYDIAVNILGFVPLGFCFFLHCQQARPNRPARTLMLTVAVGAVVSLTIEMVQAWLPNRDSTMADVVNNTLGALLGAGLAWWRWPKLTASNGKSAVRQTVT